MKPKVYYRIQKSPPPTCPYPEPGRSSPCPHFLKIHLNIILPSTRQVFVREDKVHIYKRNVQSLQAWLVTYTPLTFIKIDSVHSKS
jgi:hypothetical protein